MKLNKQNKKGFTIVELVIVIGVIGILSAILIPTFVNLTDQAKQKQLQSNLRNAYSAYVAEAADGYIGSDKTDVIALVAENEATLKEGTNSYHMDAEGVWQEGAIAEPTDADTGDTKTWHFDLVAGTEEKSTFGGYAVYHWVYRA